MQGEELRETQKALELSRDHYARLFERAPVGFAVLDRRGRIREINLTAARMLGSALTGLTGAPFSMFLDDGAKREFLAHVKRVVDSDDGTGGGTPQTAVVRLGGTAARRILRMHSTARVGDIGRECFSALLDITAEEDARAHQRSSDQLRQTVLDALPAQVAVLDGRGRLIAVNEAWRRFAQENGASAELQAGVGCDYLSACRNARGGEADSAREIADGIQAVLDSDRPVFTWEYPCHGPDRERWFVMSAVRLGGSMAGAVVLHLDVSERKRAEQEIRRARDSAAQTARLNALGVLAASLVHELTQPLGAAGFFSAAASSLLEGDEVDGDKLRQVLAGVDAQIQRAAQILERLRGFLRRHDPRLKPVAIRDVLAAASALVSWLADDKGVRLRVAQPDPGLVVEGDAMQLQQVLVNLISNAIQAIDRAAVAIREVTVDVAVRPTEVEIAVGDTGPGLGIDTEGRLSDILSSTREEGLRLGLAISREVVEAHGGKLWADPDSSTGAIFRFTLPLGEVR